MDVTLLTDVEVDRFAGHATLSSAILIRAESVVQQTRLEWRAVKFIAFSERVRPAFAELWTFLNRPRSVAI